MWVPFVPVSSAVHPEVSGLARWWRGRYGKQLATEVVVLFLLLSLYRLGRYFGRDEVGAAFHHARQVLDVERHLGLANERAFQRHLLEHVGLVRFLNSYYATVHFPATVLFLVLAYVRAPDAYRRVRLVIVSVSAVALAMHIAYPLAPPRMLPGFVDTLARWGPAVYSKPGVASVANQYAAMPSLHVGWSLIVAYGMLLVTRRPWRWLGLAHAVVTSIAVVATANHYWLDGLVAAALVAPAIALASRRDGQGHRAVPDRPAIVG